MNRFLSLALGAFSLGCPLAQAQMRTAASPVAGVPSVPMAPYGLSMQPLAPSFGAMLPGYAAPSFSVLPLVSAPKVALTGQTLALSQTPALALTPSPLSQPAVPAVAAPSPAALPAAAMPAARPVTLPAAQAPARSAAAALQGAPASPTRLAVRAEAARLNQFSAGIAPQLKAIEKPGTSHEASRAAADAVFSENSRNGSAAAVQATALGTAVRPSGLQKPAAGKRYAPAVSNVSFADGITPEQQSLLWESLKRRKAGWFRELARMGMKLDGPNAPVLTVRSTKVLKSGKTEFTVDWKQGETRLGSFRAIIPADKLSPDLRRMADPPAPEEKQLTIRFKKTVDGNAQLSRAEIEAFLESRGLRLLSGGYDGIYRAATTGEATPASVARAISGRGIVLYATPLKLDIPEERRLRVVFKKGSASESAIGDLLRDAGLTVLKTEYDGSWLLGLDKGLAEAAAAKLEKAGIVLFASALKLDIPENLHAIVRFQEAAGEDQVAALLRGRGLRVVQAHGDGVYRVAARDGTGGGDLAAALASEAAVKSATPVGLLKDEEIRSAAQSVASYKGRPWSSVDYNISYGGSYSYLVQRGATMAQLKLFSDLCDAAPMRGGGFNPWSGD